MISGMCALLAFLVGLSCKDEPNFSETVRTIIMLVVVILILLTNERII